MPESAWKYMGSAWWWDGTVDDEVRVGELALVPGRYVVESPSGCLRSRTGGGPPSAESSDSNHRVTENVLQGGAAKTARKWPARTRVISAL